MTAQNKTNQLTLDLTIFDNHQETLALITAAVAEKYFSTALTGKLDENIDKAYTTLFNLCPNYRLLIKDRPSFERFKFLNPDMATITALPVP